MKFPRPAEDYQKTIAGTPDSFVSGSTRLSGSSTGWTTSARTAATRSWHLDCTDAQREPSVKCIRTHRCLGPPVPRSYTCRTPIGHAGGPEHVHPGG